MQLTELVTRSQAEVLDTHGWITDTAWTQLAKDAVVEVSRKRAMINELSITTEPGVDSYPLPEDFLYMVSFPTLDQWRDGDVLNTPSGLIPVPSSLAYPETVRVRGVRLYLSPTPQTAITIKGEYAATHLLTESEDETPVLYYPTMSEDFALTVLKKMKVNALNIMASRAAQSVDYVEGDTRVEFSKRAKQLQELALKAEIAYLKDVDKAVVMQ